MCQIHGPAIRVGCGVCGASFYEGDDHVCKKYVPFEEWDAELQARAAQKPSGHPFWDHALLCTKDVAGWPLWKRKYAWSEEFRHSV